jgi:hypothetical protein
MADRTHTGIQKRARSTLERITPISRRRSALGDFLLQQQCWGFMQATDVQRIASLACQDMSDGGCTAPDDLKVLARLGTDGEYVGNVHRDLMARVVGPRLKIHAITRFTLPLRIKPKFCARGRLLLAPRVAETQYAMISPHLFVSQVYHHRRNIFYERILGSSTTDIDVASNLRSWWGQLAADDPRVCDLVTAYVANNTVVDRRDFFSRAVPLVMHGDAVPTGNRGSFDSLTFSSCLVADMPTIDSKILITGIDKRNVAPNSLSSLWDKVIWSMYSLLSGKHPLRSFNAQPLPPELAENAGKDLCGGLVRFIHNYSINNLLIL